jgi:uncharacterized membrane protein
MGSINVTIVEQAYLQGGLKRIMKTKTKKMVHIGFEVGMALKGAYGVLQVIFGMLLGVLSPGKMKEVVYSLARHELLEDPNDRLAPFMMETARSFSIGSQHFATVYLISHGIIKVILIYLLWRGKLWSYPLAIVTLALFAAYQVYRYTFTHSIFLVALTAVDIAMILLTVMEYRNVRMNGAQSELSD